MSIKTKKMIADFEQVLHNVNSNLMHLPCAGNTFGKRRASVWNTPTENQVTINSQL